MDEALKRQSEELEQTLQKQLELLKQDSQVYAKVAGIAVLGGLLAVGSVKLFSRGRKSDESKKKSKKKKKRGFSFFRNIRNRLFWMAFDYGKARLVENFVANLGKEDESRK
ncbi:hypothetical protein [Cyclobacterium jeungdonense]|uniref:Uncharacterized protein n=1 Tax=Cyclobacterium jeungdonense TaxID=708087 RepID=A0ABT8CA98_9BACT|nr:hypothetical protein [Cyclobacterium jeungdonense]MDN3689724.1 hypothetical protein [Cyclobacterium jeungdonense]